MIKVRVEVTLRTICGRNFIIDRAGFPSYSCPHTLRKVTFSITCIVLTWHYLGFINMPSGMLCSLLGVHSRTIGRLPNSPMFNQDQRNYYLCFTKLNSHAVIKSICWLCCISGLM